MRAPSVLYAAAGRPDPRRKTKPARGRCWWCGDALSEACELDDVLTDSFTDQDQALVRSSPWLCVACTWAMTGRPPDTLRLWSIAWSETPREWPLNHESAPNLGTSIHLQNKADPSAFRALLRCPPSGRWMCSIADSGQIHTAPFATVNRGAGRYSVRFERVNVVATPEQYRTVDDSISRLMAAGYTKQDIAEQPLPSRLIKCGLDLWRAEQEVLRPYRGSPLFDLALFLARKDQPTDDRRAEDASSNRAGARDDAQCTKGDDPPNRLVDASQERPRSGGDELGQLQLFRF